VPVGLRERVERVMLASVVPSLAVPIAAQLGAAHSDDRIAALGVTSAVASVFLFIALGSMLLNALIILRTPTTLATRRLDVATGASLWLLDGVLIVWAVALFAADYRPALVFAVATIVLSITTCVFALRRRRRAPDMPQREFVGMPPVGRVLLVAFAIAGIGLVVASPFLDVQYHLYEVVGIVEGDWQWGLMLLGLPWSYLAQWVLAVVVTPLTMSASMTFTYGAITSTTIVYSAAVLANVIIAIALLASQRFRTRFGNRFFRLRPSRPAPPPVE
jgi:hypothetical protein